MTPEQAAELNRIAVKTEAHGGQPREPGFKGLKISGYIEPAYIYNQRQDRAGFQFLNSVGDDGYNYDNSYFGAAMLDFQKETESGTKLAPDAGAQPRRRRGDRRQLDRARGQRLDTAAATCRPG